MVQQISYFLSGNTGLGLELEPEPKLRITVEPKINNFGSKTLHYYSNECANANIRKKIGKHDSKRNNSIRSQNR